VKIGSSGKMTHAPLRVKLGISGVQRNLFKIKLAVEVHSSHNILNDRSTPASCLTAVRFRRWHLCGSGVW
jgi:hypothetical protein